MSDRLTVIHADCVEGLQSLPAKSVQLIVTSPPYWGLRDYKIPPSIWIPRDLWDCPHECEHDWGAAIPQYNATKHAPSWTGKHEYIPKENVALSERGAFCSKCNAWRGCLGLEPFPGLYIDNLISIMREAWRVLRDDGTLWLNLGDSYAANGGDRRNHGPGFNSNVAKNGESAMPRTGRVEQARNLKEWGLKPGDLVGIPWRVVFALQAEGWWHRRDNIWFKPNPMPESVDGWRWEKHRLKIKGSTPGKQGAAQGNSKRRRDTSNGEYLGSAEYVECPGCAKCSPNDGLVLRKGNWRSTTSHEYVFQFSKSASYFCDAQAAREQTTGGAHHRGDGVNPKAKQSGRNSRMTRDRDPAHQTPGRIHAKQNRSFSAAVRGLVTNRNQRSVWRIPTKPFRGAHFATFPPDLVRPIIAAASPVKCCAACAAPYAPVVARGKPRAEQQRACGGDRNGNYNGTATKEFALHGAQDASAVKARILAGMVEKTVTGYRPTCLCGAEAMRPVVLDMFGGSGTVGQVANELGRDAILIEISSEYIPLIERRCHVTLPLALN